ncbi:MAG: SecD/SecF family protein translocase subunit [Clostridia bacterium]|nr:SecD/SecF family protein translocase subunit [Clostridia bacterium]
MKRTPKPVFFIVALLIVALGYTSFFGIYKNFGDRQDTVIRGASDIRTGIDINGGIEVTFAPEDASIDATDAQIEAMKEVIVRRMIANNITDYEAYTDTDNNQVVIRFPWKNNETEFDAKSAIEELGKTALLEFYIDETESTGLPTEKPKKEDFVLNGSLVSAATPGFDQENTPIVSLELDKAGKEAFSKATQKQADLNKGLTTKKYTISIWLDDECISNPTVNEHIADGNAQISGGFADYAEALDLANLINSGSLPFSITAKNTSTVTATLGERALEIMVIAGVIAFVLISLFMIFFYRLPGFVGVIALLGQVAGSIAVVSGYFPFFNSFTLTLPGIAGIILSIGMGVDANIITAERIKEQIRGGRTIDGAINNGCSESFWAIFDGNITVLIISVVLMGVFGPADSLFAKLLKPFLFMFPVSASGAVYSFGYTLLAGIIFNFIMGVTCSRLMLKSVSRFKFLRKPWLLGGKRQDA